MSTVFGIFFIIWAILFMIAVFGLAKENKLDKIDIYVVIFGIYSISHALAFLMGKI
jgi:hypothetical protein